MGLLRAVITAVSLRPSIRFCGSRKNGPPPRPSGGPAGRRKNGLTPRRDDTIDERRPRAQDALGVLDLRVMSYAVEHHHVGPRHQLAVALDHVPPRHGVLGAVHEPQRHGGGLERADPALAPLPSLG